MTSGHAHPARGRAGRVRFTVALLLSACSTQSLHQHIETSARTVQPAVSAVECGGGRAKTAIEACRAQGGHYGHCALIASRAGYASARACYTYAADIHRRREQLVGKEGDLDAEIRYLRGVNSDTERLNAELAGKIDEVTARTDTGVRSLAEGKMTQAEATQLRAILDQEVAEAHKQLDVVSRELDSAQQYRARQARDSSSPLDAEIEQLQTLLAEVQRRTRALSAQRERI
jgi:BMFP domain-containing protein YqiC